MRVPLGAVSGRRHLGHLGGQHAHLLVLGWGGDHPAVENGVEQVRRLVQRSHDPVLAKGLVGECGRLYRRHPRVLVDDPAFVEGADDGPETLDDGGGEVGPLGGLVRRPGQGVGVAVVNEH